ncbi:hypothetical protein LCGC14_0689070, partial [marine sediment metagenome]
MSNSLNVMADRTRLRSVSWIDKN